MTTTLNRLISVDYEINSAFQNLSDFKQLILHIEDIIDKPNRLIADEVGIESQMAVFKVVDALNKEVCTYTVLQIDKINFKVTLRRINEDRIQEIEFYLLPLRNNKTQLVVAVIFNEKPPISRGCLMFLLCLNFIAFICIASLLFIGIIELSSLGLTLGLVSMICFPIWCLLSDIALRYLFCRNTLLKKGNLNCSSKKFKRNLINLLTS